MEKRESYWKYHVLGQAPHAPDTRESPVNYAARGRQTILNMPFTPTLVAWRRSCGETCADLPTNKQNTTLFVIFNHS